MSASKKATRFQIYIRSAKRLALWYGLSHRLQLYLVSEFPKSGGTWFCQMLGDVLDLPFYRNSNDIEFKQAVIHGHRQYSPRFRKPICVIRDGRDVMASAYFYFLFENEINLPSTVAKFRNKLRFDDYDDVQANMPKFIEHMFVEYRKGYLHFNWSEFIDAWIDQPTLIVRYEDLLKDAALELERAVEWYEAPPVPHERYQEVADQYSFANMARRKAGSEVKTSFLRKGIAGDWRAKFNQEAKEVFDHFAGDTLIRAGYETSHNWVTESQAPIDQNNQQEQTT